MPSLPVSVRLQCVASTRVIVPWVGSQSTPPSPANVPAMCTARPVASVAAGTVTANVIDIWRTSASCVTGAEFADRFHDVSTERMTYVYVCPCATVASVYVCAAVSASTAYGPAGTSALRTS